MRGSARLRPIRVRFAKDIVAEVLFPPRQPGRVAILAGGAPGSPCKERILRFLAREGYVVVFPWYRGTWESGGYFLERSPADDLRDVIAELEKRRVIRDVWGGNIHPVRVNAIHLFGVSFGGPAVLLNSRRKAVKKVVALAPVTDWHQPGPDESFAAFVRFTLKGFGGAYRTRRQRDWRKLLETSFYDPLKREKDIVGKKICILHARDDRIVPVGPTELLARNTGVLFYRLPRGGHLSFSHLIRRPYWNRIEPFLHKQ